MEHLEGRQSVLAALTARQRKFQVILINHSAHEEKIKDVIDLADSLGVPIKRVAGSELDELAHGATHGGVLALCSPKPRTTIADLLQLLDQLSSPPLLLLIEGIEDPRNLGFTMRTAEALGAHALLIKKHLWDFDAVEVARPASGAYERLPLVQVEDIDILQKLQQRGMRLIGCIAGTKRTIYDMNLTTPTILAIGGEKRGLSGAVRGICDQLVTIPTAGGPSSLSLSHAAAIVLGETNRQRMRSQFQDE